MNPAQSASVPEFAPGSQRLMSLDALRGFDMLWLVGADALMRSFSVIHNNVVFRAVGKQFEHKDWEGFAFYDLIFPLFLFIVGVSSVFSLTKEKERHGTGGAVWRVLRRGFLLYVLGILYSGGFSNEWPDIRLLGVLNRIALAYTFTGLFFIFIPLRGLVVLCASLLVGYWALMTFVPVPEIGAGVFEKGRNLANWLDQQYLPGKRWEGNWDPEGLLSTMPAIATCMLGLFSGLWLSNPAIEDRKKVTGLLVAGIVATALGWLWSLQFPVVKKIWTSSFVLVAGGYSMLLLAAFYSIVDVWRYRKWCMPLVWVGTNAITVYLANNVIGFRRLATRFAGGDVKELLDSTLTKGVGDAVICLVAIGLGLLLCKFLYDRKIFLRL